MLAHSKILYHLAHDVKKSVSVKGKLAESSDLSSNSVIPRKLRGSKKINPKFDLLKNTASVEKHIFFHLKSVSVSQNKNIPKY